MPMHIKDGPRQGSVVKTSFLNKDIHLWPNSFIRTTMVELYKKILCLWFNKGALKLFRKSKATKLRIHDIQHNDTQHNDIQHNNKKRRHSVSKMTHNPDAECQNAS